MTLFQLLIQFITELRSAILGYQRLSFQLTQAGQVACWLSPGTDFYHNEIGLAADGYYFERVGTGQYNMVFNSGYQAGKYVFITHDPRVTIAEIDGNWLISTQDYSGNLSDGIMNYTFIEVRKYPA